MKRKLITSYGRHDVVEETLTDGSKVYSVVTVSDDGPEVIFACHSDHHAQTLASVLQTRCIDVSIRDRECV